eukprot:15996560-Heterocapsa_arctica.AAC.1
MQGRQSGRQLGRPLNQKAPPSKEQEVPAGGQAPPPQQAVGTEGEVKDVNKADNAKKRNQLRFIAKTITAWPEDAKDSAIF